LLNKTLLSFIKIQKIKVLQSDGSNYSACVNAATLAIIDAGIPIKDYVCACSVSLIRDTPLIDINHLEESSGNPHFSLALLPNYDQIVLLESASRMHVDHLDKMIESAMQGSKDIYAILNKYIKSRVASISKNFSNLI
jgi:exosome complex component RRP41